MKRPMSLWPCLSCAPSAEFSAVRSTNHFQLTSATSKLVLFSKYKWTLTSWKPFSPVLHLPTKLTLKCASFFGIFTNNTVLFRRHWNFRLTNEIYVHHFPSLQNTFSSMTSLRDAWGGCFCPCVIVNCCSVECICVRIHHLVTLCSVSIGDCNAHWDEIYAAVLDCQLLQLSIKPGHSISTFHRMTSKLGQIQRLIILW